MNIDSPLRSLTPHQYTLLMERAKRDALNLRREAIAEFWAAAARALRAGLQAVRRSVTRHRPRAAARTTP
jgi:hypothetical protein